MRLFNVIIVLNIMAPAYAQLSSTKAEAKSPSVKVPEWAKSAVWYEIFPERFRNGDPSNDPRPIDMKGSWPHEVTPGWRISSWTGDWYRLQPWEQAAKKSFYVLVQQRRYGGDLEGVIEKLDYLKNLGVNALYFTPLFESPSLHKYDATYYHHIDNNFGPDPDGDAKVWSREVPADPTTWQWTSSDKLFLTLVREAHRRNMKIVLDGVFNHVGMTFWAFQDVRKNQQASKFKDWFTIKRWDNPVTPEDEFDYEGWNGVRELPQLREDELGHVRGPREHIKAVVQRWMDPNGDGNPEDGIDGWRLDAADKVNKNFWREFRTWVRSINPEAYLVGEIWWEDWKNGVMFNAGPWLQGDMFDAVMNYRWAREAVRYFAGKNTKISTSEFNKRLELLRDEYPSETNSVLMNLFDSHDTDRLSSRIVNCDLDYDRNVGVKDNSDYEVRKPRDHELETLKLMALFQMTYIGAPMIYYGTEAGMWGGDDPDDRKPMLWADYAYEVEKSHPFDKPRPSDSVAFNQNLFTYYSTLIAFRTQSAALSRGNFVPLLVDDKNDVYCYMRAEGKNLAVVVLNNSSSPREIQIPLPDSTTSLTWKGMLDLRNSQTTKARLRLTLNPRSGEILETSR